MKKLLVLLTMVCVLLGAVIAASGAGEYPQRPITVFIPLGTGDTSDVFVRTITPHMEKFLGQTFVLVNKPTAGGATAITELAAAKPDGYTMSWANLPTLSIMPQMRKLVYDSMKLSYIATPMEYEYILYAGKDAPFNSLKEFIEHARKNPDQVTYAVPGLGTTNHLGVAWLAAKENVNMRAVPFEGNPKAIAAVMGGHATVVNTSTTASISPYQAGLIKPLAVISSSRIAFVADTPTLKELGYDFSQYSCMGAVFPENTPEPVRKRMEDAIRYAAEQPDVQKHAAEKLHIKILFRNGSEYKKLCRDYWDIWGKVLDMVGLKAQ
ncbi:MAG: tripartite tricarboxylate transporter substrate binding protein [Desulfovibrionaceae bacterium]|nr:tripartite tricarboxylate transporter substrate binding protein [Desulfovibrionaceae bacterium]